MPIPQRPSRPTYCAIVGDAGLTATRLRHEAATCRAIRLRLAIEHVRAWHRHHARGCQPARAHARPVPRDRPRAGSDQDQIELAFRWIAEYVATESIRPSCASVRGWCATSAREDQARRLPCVQSYFRRLHRPRRTDARRYLGIRRRQARCRSADGSGHPRRGRWNRGCRHESHARESAPTCVPHCARSPRTRGTWRHTE